MPPLVLKIGGSLAGSGTLRGLLDLAVSAARPIIIVPGGGAYADAVRTDQMKHGLSDVQAHRLAILAMHRMAADFQSIQPALLLAQSLDDMNDAWSQHRTPVWLPWTMVEHEPSVAQDWSMTSDGLAAWLAAKIGGAEVALVKACAVPPNATLEDLAAAGIIDAQFPKIVTGANLKWHVFGPDDGQRLTALVAH